MTPISKHFLASLCRLSFALTTAVRCLRKLSQTAVPREHCMWLDGFIPM